MFRAWSKGNVRWWAARNLNGDALDDLDADQFKSLDFFRVVGDETDRFDTKLLEDLGWELEIAAVGLVAQLEAGFDGVEALILQLVGAELRHEANAAAFRLLVEKDADARIRDSSHRELNLLAAIAAQRVEDLAVKALGMDPDDRGCAVDVSHDQCHGGFYAAGRGGNVVSTVGRVINQALEAEDTEVSPAGGKIGVGYFGYACEFHLLVTVGNSGNKHNAGR